LATENGTCKRFMRSAPEKCSQHGTVGLSTEAPSLQMQLSGVSVCHFVCLVKHDEMLLTTP